MLGGKAYHLRPQTSVKSHAYKQQRSQNCHMKAAKQLELKYVKRKMERHFEQF